MPSIPNVGTPEYEALPGWRKAVCWLVSLAILVAVVAVVVAIVIAGWRTVDDWRADKQAEAEACRLNGQCWGEEHRIDAELACAPVVERQARYNHDWTDGWEGSKFTTWHWSGDSADGIIQYRGNKVRFQNAFGVWVPMVYGCYYNTETESVVGVMVEAR